MRRMTKNDKGFTLIEVMVAAVVLAIGLVGILGMQAVSAITNRRAQDIRVGMELAESAMERLKVDAIAWVGDETVIPSDSWLGTGLTDENLNAWTLPPVNPADGQGTFNDMGLRGTTTSALPSGNDYFVEKSSRYCIQYRLGWVIEGQMARVEVRSIWPSNVNGEATLNGSCENLAGLNEGTLDLQFEWVKIAGMVRWNQTGATPTGPRT